MTPVLIDGHKENLHVLGGSGNLLGGRKVSLALMAETSKPLSDEALLEVLHRAITEMDELRVRSQVTVGESITLLDLAHKLTSPVISTTPKMREQQNKIGGH
jgi:hypothetical protein